jgi:hypothetical protein
MLRIFVVQMVGAASLDTYLLYVIVLSERIDKINQLKLRPKLKPKPMPNPKSKLEPRPKLKPKPNLSNNLIKLSRLDVPSMFGGIPLPKSLNNWTPLEKTSDLNCAENIQGCRWFAIEKSMAKWRIGKHKHDWSNIMRSKSYPDGDFIFQYIDPMAELPLGHLQSELVQCTQAPSSLSFR